MKSVNEFSQAKSKNEKISVVTCYDYWSAKIISKSNIDAVLVGDSLAMIMHGYENTVNADIEMMAFHIMAVKKGIGDKFLIGDMPFLAHRKGIPFLMESVDKLIKSGANAVKIEGGVKHIETISHVIDSGVPVMGHIGLTPQSIHGIGGWKVQGKNSDTADMLIEDAKKLEEAGCFAIVLELVPADLAKTITEKIKIPTIGIGAGKYTSGQVLVFQDMLGLNNGFNPKFLRKYLDGHTLILDSLNKYNDDVKENGFPSEEESF